MGRLIVIAGLLVVVAGAVIWLAERVGVPIGRLPGDIVYRGKNTVVVFPLVTCLIISIVLTLISWIFSRR